MIKDNTIILYKKGVVNKKHSIINNLFSSFYFKPIILMQLDSI